MATSTNLSVVINGVASKLGYSELRQNQRRAILEFCKGSDVFVCLPTGSGKSLCYWCLPLVFDELKTKDGSVVLVVSPLTALIADQVSSLRKLGIKSINVSKDIGEKKKEALHQGEYQIILFSPDELLQNELWHDMILSKTYNKALVGLVVDEAHCVKKWWVNLISHRISNNFHIPYSLYRGSEFRKEFSHLGEVRSLLPDHTHVMALTATATVIGGINATVLLIL